MTQSYRKITSFSRLSALLALLLVAPLAASADAPPSATATLTPETIHVGDPATLVLTIDHSGSVRPILPDLDRGDAIRVLSATVTNAPSPDAPDFRRTTATYRLTSFAVTNDNPVALPTVTIPFQSLAKGANDAPDAPPSVLPDPIPFPFANLAVETTLAPDNSTTLQPPVLSTLSWPRRPYLRPILITLAALILLAGLVLLAIYLIRRRRAAAAIPPPPPPPHETALAALDDLAARHAAEPIPPEPFTVALTTILRRYLEDRFALRAPTSTTDEFIRAAATANLLAPPHQTLVADFLRQSDLVKFARADLTPSEQLSALSLARRVVLETIPAPPAPAEPSAPSLPV